MEKYVKFVKLFRGAQRSSNILAIFTSRWYSYSYILVISTQCNNSLDSLRFLATKPKKTFSRITSPCEASQALTNAMSNSVYGFRQKTAVRLLSHEHIF